MGCLLVSIDNLGFEPSFNSNRITNSIELVITKIKEDLNISFNKKEDLQPRFILNSSDLEFKSSCDNNVVFNIKAVSNEAVLSIYKSTQNLILNITKSNEDIKLNLENKSTNMTFHLKVLNIMKLIAIFSLLCNITPLEPIYLRSLDDDKLIDSFERVLISLK